MTVLVLTVCPVMADRRGGNQSRLCLGACRCLVEDEGNRQVSQKLKALEQSQKQLTTIIIGGAHDDGSHGSKCLMGLRPGIIHGPDSTCKCNGWFRVGLF